APQLRRRSPTAGEERRAWKDAAVPCSGPWSCLGLRPAPEWSSSVPLAISLHRIIFAQRRAFPIFGHHDAPQIRMAEETDSEQVENFTFEEICGRPYRRHRFNGSVVALEANLKTYAVFPLHGEQVVGHLKTRLARIKIGAGNIGEEVDEAPCFQLRAGFTDRF